MWRGHQVWWSETRTAVVAPYVVAHVAVVEVAAGGGQGGRGGGSGRHGATSASIDAHGNPVIAS
jgi:hypothetical protein